ncbi:hypothetical protein Bca101_083635 [Brassica carinata]
MCFELKSKDLPSSRVFPLSASSTSLVRFRTGSPLSLRNELMAGKGGGKTKKKSGKSDAPVVEELSDGNTSDDLPVHPSERMKGQKRRRPCTGGGVSSRTRARKAVSDGNEPAKEVAVQQESAPVRDTDVVSLSLDAESEDMSAVSSKAKEDGSERWHSKSSEIRKNESRKTESTTKSTRYNEEERQTEEECCYIEAMYAAAGEEKR